MPSFRHTTEDDAMKILVHLQDELKKTFLFVLREETTQDDLRSTIEGRSVDELISDLAGRSHAMVEIQPDDHKRYELLADYTFNQMGYSSERLA